MHALNKEACTFRKLSFLGVGQELLIAIPCVLTYGTSAHGAGRKAFDN